jgi:phosphoglycerate kinase
MFDHFLINDPSHKSFSPRAGEGARMNKLTIDDLSLAGKRVLMRVDFNVPLEHGRVVDDQRVRAALPSILKIVKAGGRLVLMSHLGRPKGQPDPDLSLRPCANVVASLLGQKVSFVQDCIGPEVQGAAAALNDSGVLLLENLRFYGGEKANDPDFAAELSKLGEVYINDAFGTAHRAHASTEGVTHFFDQCAAGYLMMKEIDQLGKLMDQPEKPFVAVMGGAKISGKIEVIENLLTKVDRILIGGGMSFTFFKAQGLEIGDSLLESDKIPVAEGLLNRWGEKICLPTDCMITDSLDFKGRKLGVLKQVGADSIPAGWIGVDIGKESIGAFRQILYGAKTVVWNGPMGIFEIEDSARGTDAIAECLAKVTTNGATTVVGGGDSAAAIHKAGLAERVTHVSTGGGASLEFIEGKTLPGVAALTDK